MHITKKNIYNRLNMNSDYKYYKMNVTLITIF